MKEIAKEAAWHLLDAAKVLAVAAVVLVIIASIH